MKYISIVLGIYITHLILVPGIGHSASQNDPAVTALERYLQMRLHNADWREYSKIITWPDEPSWDCWWVDEDYRIGTAKKIKNRIIIPVTQTRIGLYCDTGYFEADQRAVTINYELAFQNNQWKIDGPIPDYPDIGVITLVEKLKSSKNTADVLKKIERARSQNR